MPEAIKVNSMMTYGERLLTIKSHDHLTKCLCEGTWQIKNIESFFMRIPIVTKLFRIVTYCENVAWLFNHVIFWFWFFLIWFACLECKRLSHQRHLILKFTKTSFFICLNLSQHYISLKTFHIVSLSCIWPPMHN